MLDIRNTNLRFIDYTNKAFNETLRFYLLAQLLESETAKSYILNGKFRDYKIVKKEDLPEGFANPATPFNENGELELISIRAIHMMAYCDLIKGKSKFLENDRLKTDLLKYDSLHGNLIFRYLNGIKIEPLYRLRLRLILEGNEGQLASGNVNHIENVFGLNNKPALLVYAYDDNRKANFTLYIDNEISDLMELTFANNEVTDK